MKAVVSETLNQNEPRKQRCLMAQFKMGQEKNKRRKYVPR